MSDDYCNNLYEKLLERAETLKKENTFYIDYIKQLGGSSDTCTQHVTKEVCISCRCGKQLI